MTDPVRIPMYAKSTHPDVIAAIERNATRKREYGERARAFAMRYSDLGERARFYTSGWGHDKHLVGIESRREPREGRWTRRDSGAWRPFKKNPIYAEMVAIRSSSEQVPGTPDSIDGPYNPDGSQVVMTPGLFVHDGVAWFRLPSEPHPDQRGIWNSGPDFDPDLWTEVLASEWHAAHEAYQGVSRG